MDINKLIERVKNVLLSPKTEWPVIAQEQTDIVKLYTGYIMILAAIPAVCGFLSNVVFSGLGIVLSFVVMILSYGISLGIVFLMALIVDALAPTFGAQKSQIQALKTMAYAYTASWVAGVFYLIPIIGGILVLLSSIYSLVQLYFALPHTMKTPPEKTGGYLAVIIAISIVLTFIFMAIIGAITVSALVGAAALRG